MPLAAPINVYTMSIVVQEPEKLTLETRHDCAITIRGGPSGESALGGPEGRKGVWNVFGDRKILSVC